MQPDKTMFLSLFLDKDSHGEISAPVTEVLFHVLTVAFCATGVLMMETNWAGPYCSSLQRNWLKHMTLVSLDSSSIFQTFQYMFGQDVYWSWLVNRVHPHLRFPILKQQMAVSRTPSAPLISKFYVETAGARHGAGITQRCGTQQLWAHAAWVGGAQRRGFRTVLL